MVFDQPAYGLEQPRHLLGQMTIQIRAILFGEPDAFHANAIDIRWGVAYGAHAIGADVLPADIIAPVAGRAIDQ